MTAVRLFLIIVFVLMTIGMILLWLGAASAPLLLWGAIWFYFLSKLIT